MNKADDSEWVDIVIGEAVMALFSEELPVSYDALLSKLQEMLAAEKSAAKTRSLFLAFREIQGAEHPAINVASNEQTLH
ncbi:MULTISPECIES: hypothetical protein [Pantoea]|uniref:hypothetical protein n=1 Tax=Pantoea TaxID=53335 RepID=UPI000DE53BD0|nr:hypothetical protein [Pantoea sp. 3_1284]RBO13650.1 hypothetical protein DSL62_06900 [Pantoea sp. 3_1284]